MDMTWTEVISELIQIIFRIITVIVIPYLAYVLKNKTENDHIRDGIDRAEKLVTNSVAMVKQTFVDSLKTEGKFDEEAQKKAFELCYDNWMSMVSEEIKDILIYEFGSLETWLKTKIEFEVTASKKNG